MTMRIYSSTIWLLSALLVGANDVTFNSSDFNGDQLSNTSIFSWNQMLSGNNGGNGWMFRWTPNQKNGGPLVKTLVLAQVNESAIVSLTNSSDSIAVDWDGGSCTLSPFFINNNMTFYENSAVLYFQLEWSHNPNNIGHERDTSSTYSYSPPWAVADNNSSAQALLKQVPALSNPDQAYHTEGSTPVAQPNVSGAPASAASSTGSSSATATNTTSSKGSSKSEGLSTGAIAGIVVGGVVLLVLLSVGAGCLCLRNRRSDRRRADGEHHGRDVHTIQDLMAEKEARAIMETASDTPYSERDSQHAMHLHRLQLRRHSSISLSRLGGENRVAAGEVGTARDRGSGMIGSMITTTGRGTGGSPTHHDGDHDSDDSAELGEHVSMMSSPVHRVSSSQQEERVFTPYIDRPPTDYSQHHRVVDGADLVQQEQSNSSTSPGAAGGNVGEEQQQKQRPPPLKTQGTSSSNDHTEGYNNEDATSAHSSSPEMRPAGFARARSTTPSGISRRYAHLIEDGMTDEEIRRLEEEERALDEAIEQRATGRATPR